jgi:hypothetical protein
MAFLYVFHDFSWSISYVTGTSVGIKSPPHARVSTLAENLSTLQIFIGATIPLSDICDTRMAFLSITDVLVMIARSLIERERERWETQE